MTTTLPRRIVAEFVGTGFLVAAVIGSGIMAERLAGGNAAIALLANTIATGAALATFLPSTSVPSVVQSLQTSCSTYEWFQFRSTYATVLPSFSI